MNTDQAERIAGFGLAYLDNNLCSWVPGSSLRDAPE